MTIKNLTNRIEDMNKVNTKAANMIRERLNGHTVHEAPELMKENVMEELAHLEYCMKVRKFHKDFLVKLDTVINTIKNA